MTFKQRLLASWKQANLLSYLLLPLSWIYRLLFSIRRQFYQMGIFKSVVAAVPVIVVGNLTVGGTGKTPIVIYLIELLRQRGFSPGVISRGYGGQVGDIPLLVGAETDPLLSGDEPALIVKRTGVPMIVGARRTDDIQVLLAQFDCDVVISDDGLQHFAMGRDIEVCMDDQTTLSDNQFCLPAGPYRESINRLQTVDFVIQHKRSGGLPAGNLLDGNSRIHSMCLVADKPRPLNQKTEKSLPDNATINAVAGIGKPPRFFEICRQLGYEVIEHAFSDHHRYTVQDILFENSLPTLMTEKDEVKCAGFEVDQHWVLPVTAQLDRHFDDQFIDALRTLIQRKYA